MNWQALSAVAEAVAAVGVILSLIYVGVQIRQGAIETRVGVLRAVVNELGRVHDSLAEHGDLADIVVRGFGNYDALSVVERARMSSYLAHMYKLFEQLFVLHATRAIDAADWRGFERAIADLTAYPGVQEWLNTRSHWMRPEFVAFLRGLPGAPSGANIFHERVPPGESSQPAIGR